MPAAVEGTYKSRDVEGLLDIYFYRRVGFLLARFFARLGMTPTGVTSLSLISGLAAGRLYYYRDLRLNLLGMSLHILSNALDNADGQLARLTNRGSRSGRILDSLSDHIVFVGIYLHLVLRCLAGGTSPAIWLLALAAGLCHAVQGGFADYFRNAYLFFVAGRLRAEVDSSVELRAEYEQLLWRREPWQKFLLRTYLNFTLGQETFSPNLMRLRAAAGRAFPSTIPDALQTRYRAAARPLLKWIGLLMTNARMLVLFLLLILDHPAWYFLMEVTVLNLVLAYALVRQKELCRLFLPEIERLA
ncbi:MAG: CDP-alcohol phosphatidyltransferase family protein [Chthoniobacterales bacterium]